MIVLVGCGRIAFDPNDSAGDGGHADAPTTDGGTSATSCRELHLLEPSLPSGVYELDLDGGGPTVVRRLYCDMATAGGGWTLVGRSTAGASTSTFGWNGATGDVDDDSMPYSLGAISADLAFSDLLVGSHGGSKAFVDHAYVVPAASNFIGAYAQASLRSESSTVVGTCAPSPFVTMLLYKGQTDLAGVFWFRDSEFVGGTPHGLFPDGWDTYYPGDCMQGGLLHTTQGMIFVR